jgi:hypothetical protein
MAYGREVFRGAVMARPEDDTAVVLGDDDLRARYLAKAASLGQVVDPAAIEALAEEETESD